MLDDQLLRAFMGSFFGYGSLAAPLWFIGMEEGGGEDINEIQARLAAWDERGRRSVEDVAEYHIHFGIDKLFTGKRPPTQRTWAKLIRATLAARRANIGIDDIRNYQMLHWGRLEGQTCLLELLPLPSRSKNDWLYRGFSTIDFLQTRAAYEVQVAPARIRAIKGMIEEHEPRIVVFYGKGYQHYWNEITGPDVSWRTYSWGAMGQVGAVTYFSVSHPASRGVTNTQFDQIGVEIARTLGAVSTA